MKAILLSALLLSSACGIFWSNSVEDTDVSGYSHDDGYLAFWYAFAAQCDYASVLETWTNGVPHAPEDMVGFQLHEVIRTVGVLPGGLQSYVGWDSTRERIVVAFRGSDNADNWIRTNLNLIPDSYPNAAELSDPKLHGGFYGAFKELEEAGIATAMEEMTAQHPGANVFVTGHSLGGALASTAALEFVLSPVYSDMDIGRVDIITFGSVRVFNEELATHFNEVIDSSWRIVNRYDLAATVPIKAMGYYHVGTEVWYNYRRWWWEINELEYRVCDGSGEDPTCFGTDFWADRVPMWTHHSQYMNMTAGPRKDMMCRSAPASVSVANNDAPMFGVNSLKAMKETKTKARGDVDPCGLPKRSGYCFGYFTQYYYDLSSGQCEQFVYGGCGGNENNFNTKADCEAKCVIADNEIVPAVDIGLIANWAGIISTGQGIVGLIGSDFGATIRIKNYLCGGALRYEGSFYLAKGSFKAHCSSVMSGQEAGCTPTGWINNGVYGTVQYDFITAFEGYEDCGALNVFFQASQGWGWGSQKKNRVDVFWSNQRCRKNEDNKDDISCYLNQRRMRDDKKCWIKAGEYDPICSEKWDDPDARGVCGDLQAVGRIGANNNPEVLIEVRAISDPLNSCGAPGS